MPDAGGSFFLPHLVGFGKALELAMLADEVSGPEAERLGLANTCVPAAQFEEMVKVLARRLAKGPTRTYGLINELMRTAVTSDLETTMRVLHYAEASTSKLARESAVTEPMLYKHFGSKKGLFLAVLGEFSAQFLDTLQERISRRAEKDVLRLQKPVPQEQAVENTTCQTSMGGAKNSSR